MFKSSGALFHPSSSLVHYSSARGVRTLSPKQPHWRTPWEFRIAPKKTGLRIIGPRTSEQDRWEKEWDVIPWFGREPAPKNYTTEPDEFLIDKKTAKFLGDQFWDKVNDETGRLEIPIGYQGSLPQLVVPDLKGFKLKPYVSFKVDADAKFVKDSSDVPQTTSQVLFDKFLAETVKIELKTGNLSVGNSALQSYSTPKWLPSGASIENTDKES